MSNAFVEVKFKDGTILYTQYQGSSDTFYYALFKTKDEAWSYNRSISEHWEILNRSEELQEPEEVEIYCDYGGGSDWTGKACKKTMQLRPDYPEDWFPEGWF